MLRLVSDEDFNGDVVRGLLKRQPDLDVVRVQDVGLRSADDPTILAWAAAEGRIVLTHDRATMPKYAYERVRSGERMPGMIVIRNKPPFALMIDEILMAAICSSMAEWEDRVEFLPL